MLQPLKPIRKPEAVTSLAPQTSEKKPPEKQEEVKGNRLRSLYRAKVGSLIFSLEQGALLSRPYVPQIRLATYRVSEAKFVINDPDGKFYQQISKFQAVEVEIGFVDGPRRNKFVGSVYSFGRIPPDGTEVIAVDNSFVMQQTGSSVQFNQEQPQSQGESLQQLIASNDAFSPKAIQSATVSVQAGGELSQLLGASATLPTTSGLQANGSTPSAEVFSKASNLKFANDSTFQSQASGTVRTQQTDLQAAAQQAHLAGDKLVTRGNTVRQVSPGKEEPTGVVFDYKKNPSAFLGRPICRRRTGLQLQGPGSLTVLGYNVTGKELVGATVVTQGAAPEHPTGVIQVPEWGAVKIGDPIFPGCIYTWADATKNGTRIPTKAVMGRIAEIAQVIQPLTDKTVGKGKKWTITSWYRDPTSNRIAGGATDSQHLYGGAVDAYFPGMEALHRSLSNSWAGGIAISPGSFIHIDTLKDPPNRRWVYGR